MFDEKLFSVLLRRHTSYHAKILYGKRLKENNYLFYKKLDSPLSAKRVLSQFKSFSNESFLGPVYTRPESTNPQKYFLPFWPPVYTETIKNGIVFSDSGKI